MMPHHPILRLLPLTSGLSPTPNIGHTASAITFAQIQPNGWTSHVRKTLSEIEKIFMLNIVNP